MAVEALDIVTVEYSADGGALQKKTLQPEEVLNIKGKQKIRMEI